MRAEKFGVGTGYYDALLRACQLLAETDDESTAEDSEKARGEFEARLLAETRRWKPG